MRWVAGLGVVLCFALGCGDDESDMASGTSGSPGTGGLPTSDGSAGTGGTGGSSATSSGGSAGTPPRGCSGAWHEAPDALAAELNFSLSSPTLSPDELEMFYVEGVPAAQEYNFRHTTRSSKSAAFPAGDVVSEFDALCVSGQGRSIDLSRDGLTAYLGCHFPLAGDLNPLHVARRPQLGAKFVLDAQSYGMVGPSVAIAPDELVLYSSGQIGTIDSPPPRRYTRSSTSAPFADPLPVPGLESSGLITPELSPDGLSIFGSANLSLIVAERSRPDGAFAAPTTILPGTPNMLVLGAPEVAQDCRSLYFVQNEPASGASFTSRIRVLTR